MLILERHDENTDRRGTLLILAVVFLEKSYPHCTAVSICLTSSVSFKGSVQKSRTNYFFLDIFSMNQHDFADLGTKMDCADLRDMYDTMLEALTQSIEIPGCMLLALTPHERPKMLTRSWCLYEIYIAWKVKAEVSCGFIPEAEHAVKQSLTQNDRLIRRMLGTIDAEQSSATVKTDRDMILQLIHRDGTERPMAGQIRVFLVV